MSTFPDTHSGANGPVSYWAVAIPTTNPGGIHARLWLHHGDAWDQRDGRQPTLRASLTDRDGTWVKDFWSPEEWVEWLDAIAAGPVRRVDHQKRPALGVAA